MTHLYIDQTGDLTLKKMEADKQLKDENNSKIKTGNIEDGSDVQGFEGQFSFSPQTEAVLKANVSEQALENIKHIFNKTRAIREVADGRHQEIQAQFKELRERLSNSSECLQRMKKGIDNVKFSYQAKVGEINRRLTPSSEYLEAPHTKEAMAQQVEEIRRKIEEIQSRVSQDKAKQTKVIESYQEAFDHVSAVLQNIEQGDYSSFVPENVKKSQ